MALEQQAKQENFITEVITKDLEAGKHSEITTRFPPEPNGYLHIGHAKSICLNFSLSQTFKGKTYLRFDDTNPSKEETKYVDSIKEDIAWLGFQWDKVTYASDYFPILYDYAIKLIKKGLAYVDDTPFEQLIEMRGDVNTAGTASTFRERKVEENLELFTKMREGKFADQEKVLRAKIDLSSPIMQLRDPILYRIKKQSHHRTGDQWCIYPTYDFAHGQGDSIEKVTHSICTLEFVPHRPLYDWLIDALDIFPSKQYEFARLNLTYTIMSKRFLSLLVEKQIVDGWDDPRMPTIAGVRRRGYPAVALRKFCEHIGVTKRENVIDIELLESFVRAELNKTAIRAMVVFEPILLTITNYDKEQETLVYVNNPEDETCGTRKITFSNQVWIERNDVSLNPEKKFFRIKKDGYVRLKHAYIIQCNEIITDDQNNIMEVKATYFPESKSGSDKSGIKAKGTIHWVDRKTAVQNEVKELDRLFLNKSPSLKEQDLEKEINPQSEKTYTAYMEPFMNDTAESSFQFIRKGYFVREKAEKNKNVFLQTATLKEGWKRRQN